MGLDMYVFRAKKPDVIPNKIYRADDWDNNNMLSLTPTDIESPMFLDLMPYCSKIYVRHDDYDLQKIMEAYGFGETPHISYYDEKSIWFSGRSSGAGIDFDVEIGFDELREKYTLHTTIEERYYCRVSSDEDEVQYWRKAYEVQDWFHEHIDRTIENCGYYILDADLIEAYNRKFAENDPDSAIPVEEPDEFSALFYHEWY